MDEARQKGKQVTPILAEQGINIPEELENYPLATWNRLKKQGIPPTIPSDGETAITEYISRVAVARVLISHVCLKVPIGESRANTDSNIRKTAVSDLYEPTGKFYTGIVP